ncbi:hypothetical protein N9A87_04215, partial [Euryarchaeota archaeon]|nr:hypothetical protein [Euryarchaeota archaeon]
MVEIGASSNEERSISTSASELIRGSKIPTSSPPRMGDFRVAATRARMRAFSSEAAFLVKVIATTSLG